MIRKYDLPLSAVDLIFELNFGGTHSQYEDLNNCKKVFVFNSFMHNIPSVC